MIHGAITQNSHLEWFLQKVLDQKWLEVVLHTADQKQSLLNLPKVPLVSFGNPWNFDNNTWYKIVKERFHWFLTRICNSEFSFWKHGFLARLCNSEFSIWKRWFLTRLCNSEFSIYISLQTNTSYSTNRIVLRVGRRPKHARHVRHVARHVWHVDRATWTLL